MPLEMMLISCSPSDESEELERLRNEGIVCFIQARDVLVKMQHLSWMSKASKVKQSKASKVKQSKAE